MSKKEKEEEKIERIIRCLLKLPENSRCINCYSLGPQYICTTFWTFVCTNCSGVHREFTHRVKSISMAKFSAEEVSALQAGGNERAKQIYLKDWDPQRNSYPESSNIYRLRDFIKQVYVDRKYSGERSQEKFTRLRLRDKDDSYESRKVGAHRGPSQSPHHEDRYERSRSERWGPGGRNDGRTLKYYFDEGISPRYKQENSRHGGSKRQTAHFEVVDDRFRDDGSRSGRFSDSCRFSHRESGLGSRSLGHHNSIDQSVSPAVHPVKDILAEKFMPLQVEDDSKAIERKESNVSVHNKACMSSSNMPSAEKNPAEHKNLLSDSFIDLNTESAVASAALTQEKNPAEHKNQLSDSFIDSNTESNSSDASAALTQENRKCSGGGHSSQSLTRSARKWNSVEFLVFELSAPSVEPSGYDSGVPRNDNLSIPVSGGNMLMHGSESPAAHLGHMLTSTYSSDASEKAYGTNNPSGQVSLALPVVQTCTPSSALSASTASYGPNMLPNGASPPAPRGQLVSISSASSSMFSSSMAATAPVRQNSGVDSFDPSSNSSNNNFPAQLSTGPPQAAPGSSGDSTSMVVDVQSSVLPGANKSSNGQQNATRIGAPNNQMLTSFDGPDAQETSCPLVGQPTQEESKLAQGALIKLQSKSTERKELPTDLFTVSHIPASRPVPGWPTAPPYGMGFSTQYPSPMPALGYSSQSRSFNPFDVNNELAPNQAPQFPSMQNFGGALPNLMAPGVVLPTLGVNSNTSVTTPQSPAAMLRQSSSTFASAMTSGGYSGQQLYMNMPLSGDRASLLNSFDTSQQPTSGCTIQTYPNYFPAKGGNPFG